MNKKEGNLKDFIKQRKKEISQESKNKKRFIPFEIIQKLIETPDLFFCDISDISKFIKQEVIHFTDETGTSLFDHYISGMKIFNRKEENNTENIYEKNFKTFLGMFKDFLNEKNKNQDSFIFSLYKINSYQMITDLLSYCNETATKIDFNLETIDDSSFNNKNFIDCLISEYGNESIDTLNNNFYKKSNNQTNTENKNNELCVNILKIKQTKIKWILKNIYDNFKSLVLIKNQNLLDITEIREMKKINNFLLIKDKVSAFNDLVTKNVLNLKIYKDVSEILKFINDNIDKDNFINFNNEIMLLFSTIFYYNQLDNFIKIFTILEQILPHKDIFFLLFNIQALDKLENEDNLSLANIDEIKFNSIKFNENYYIYSNNVFDFLFKNSLQTKDYQIYEYSIQFRKIFNLFFDLIKKLPIYERIFYLIYQQKMKRISFFKSLGSTFKFSSEIKKEILKEFSSIFEKHLINHSQNLNFIQLNFKNIKFLVKYFDITKKKEDFEFLSYLLDELDLDRLIGNVSKNLTIIYNPHDSSEIFIKELLMLEKNSIFKPDLNEFYNMIKEEICLWMKYQNSNSNFEKFIHIFLDRNLFDFKPFFKKISIDNKITSYNKFSYINTINWYYKIKESTLTYETLERILNQLNKFISEKNQILDSNEQRFYYNFILIDVIEFINCHLLSNDKIINIENFFEGSCSQFLIDNIVMISNLIENSMKIGDDESTKILLKKYPFISERKYSKNISIIHKKNLAKLSSKYYINFTEKLTKFLEKNYLKISLNLNDFCGEVNKKNSNTFENIYYFYDKTAQKMRVFKRSVFSEEFLAKNNILDKNNRLKYIFKDFKIESGIEKEFEILVSKTNENCSLSQIYILKFFSSPFSKNFILNLLNLSELSKNNYIYDKNCLDLIGNILISLIKREQIIKLMSNLINEISSEKYPEKHLVFLKFFENFIEQNYGNYDQINLFNRNDNFYFNYSNKIQFFEFLYVLFKDFILTDFNFNESNFLSRVKILFSFSNFLKRIRNQEFYEYFNISIYFVFKIIFLNEHIEKLEKFNGDKIHKISFNKIAFKEIKFLYNKQQGIEVNAKNYQFKNFDSSICNKKAKIKSLFLILHYKILNMSNKNLLENFLSGYENLYDKIIAVEEVLKLDLNSLFSEKYLLKNENKNKNKETLPIINIFINPKFLNEFVNDNIRNTENSEEYNYIQDLIILLELYDILINLLSEYFCYYDCHFFKDYFQGLFYQFYSCKYNNNSKNSIDNHINFFQHQLVELAENILPSYLNYKMRILERVNDLNNDEKFFDFLKNSIFKNKFDYKKEGNSEEEKNVLIELIKQDPKLFYNYSYLARSYEMDHSNELLIPSDLNKLKNYPKNFRKTNNISLILNETTISRRRSFFSYYINFNDDLINDEKVFLRNGLIPSKIIFSNFIKIKLSEDSDHLKNLILLLNSLVKNINYSNIFNPIIKAKLENSKFKNDKINSYIYNISKIACLNNYQIGKQIFSCYDSTSSNIIKNCFLESYLIMKNINNNLILNILNNASFYNNHSEDLFDLNYHCKIAKFNMNFYVDIYKMVSFDYSKYSVNLHLKYNPLSNLLSNDISKLNKIQDYFDLLITLNDETTTENLKNFYPLNDLIQFFYCSEEKKKINLFIEMSKILNDVQSKYLEEDQFFNNIKLIHNRFSSKRELNKNGIIIESFLYIVNDYLEKKLSFSNISFSINKFLNYLEILEIMFSPEYQLLENQNKLNASIIGFLIKIFIRLMNHYSNYISNKNDEVNDIKKAKSSFETLFKKFFSAIFSIILNQSNIKYLLSDYIDNIFYLLNFTISLKNETLLVLFYKTFRFYFLLITNRNISQMEKLIFSEKGERYYYIYFFLSLAIYYNDNEVFNRIVEYNNGEILFNQINFNYNYSIRILLKNPNCNVPIRNLNICNKWNLNVFYLLILNKNLGKSSQKFESLKILDLMDSLKTLEFENVFLDESRNLFKTHSYNNKLDCIVNYQHNASKIERLNFINEFGINANNILNLYSFTKEAENYFEFIFLNKDNELYDPDNPVEENNEEEFANLNFNNEKRIFNDLYKLFANDDFNLLQSDYQGKKIYFNFMKFILIILKCKDYNLLRNVKIHGKEIKEIILENQILFIKFFPKFFQDFDELETLLMYLTGLEYSNSSKFDYVSLFLEYLKANNKNIVNEMLSQIKFINLLDFKNLITKEDDQTCKNKDSINVINNYNKNKKLNLIIYYFVFFNLSTSLISFLSQITEKNILDLLENTFGYIELKTFHQYVIKLNPLFLDIALKNSKFEIYIILLRFIFLDENYGNNKKDNNTFSKQSEFIVKKLFLITEKTLSYNDKNFYKFIKRYNKILLSRLILFQKLNFFSNRIYNEFIEDKQDLNPNKAIYLTIHNSLKEIFLCDKALKYIFMKTADSTKYLDQTDFIYFMRLFNPNTFSLFLILIFLVLKIKPLSEVYFKDLVEFYQTDHKHSFKNFTSFILLLEYILNIEQNSILAYKTENNRIKISEIFSCAENILNEKLSISHKSSIIYSEENKINKESSISKSVINLDDDFIKEIENDYNDTLRRINKYTNIEIGNKYKIIIDKELKEYCESFYLNIKSSAFENKIYDLLIKYNKEFKFILYDYMDGNKNYSLDNYIILSLEYDYASTFSTEMEQKKSIFVENVNYLLNEILSFENLFLRQIYYNLNERILPYPSLTNIEETSCLIKSFDFLLDISNRNEMVLNLYSIEFNDQTFNELKKFTIKNDLSGNEPISSCIRLKIISELLTTIETLHKKKYSILELITDLLNNECVESENENNAIDEKQFLRINTDKLKKVNIVTEKRLYPDYIKDLNNHNINLLSNKKIDLLSFLLIFNQREFMNTFKLYFEDIFLISKCKDFDIHEAINELRDIFSDIKTKIKNNLLSINHENSYFRKLLYLFLENDKINGYSKTIFENLKIVYENNIYGFVKNLTEFLNKSLSGFKITGYNNILNDFDLLKDIFEKERNNSYKNIKERLNTNNFYDEVNREKISDFSEESIKNLNENFNTHNFSIDYYNFFLKIILDLEIIEKIINYYGNILNVSIFNKQINKEINKYNIFHQLKSIKKIFNSDSLFLMKLWENFNQQFLKFKIKLVDYGMKISEFNEEILNKITSSQSIKNTLEITKRNNLKYLSQVIFEPLIFMMETFLDKDKEILVEEEKISRNIINKKLATSLYKKYMTFYRERNPIECQFEILLDYQFNFSLTDFNENIINLSLKNIIQGEKNIKSFENNEDLVKSKLHNYSFIFNNFHPTVEEYISENLNKIRKCFYSVIYGRADVESEIYKIKVYPYKTHEKYVNDQMKNMNNSAFFFLSEFYRKMGQDYDSAEINQQNLLIQKFFENPANFNEIIKMIFEKNSKKEKNIYKKNKFILRLFKIKHFESDFLVKNWMNTKDIIKVNESETNIYITLLKNFMLPNCLVGKLTEIHYRTLIDMVLIIFNHESTKYFSHFYPQMFDYIEKNVLNIQNYSISAFEEIFSKILSLNKYELDKNIHKYVNPYKNDEPFLSFILQLKFLIEVFYIENKYEKIYATKISQKDLNSLNLNVKNDYKYDKDLFIDNIDKINLNVNDLCGILKKISFDFNNQDYKLLGFKSIFSKYLDFEINDLLKHSIEIDFKEKLREKMKINKINLEYKLLNENSSSKILSLRNVCLTVVATQDKTYDLNFEFIIHKIEHEEEFQELTYFPILNKTDLQLNKQIDLKCINK